MSIMDSQIAFKKYLQTYDLIHDQPLKKFMAHLGQDHILSSTTRVYKFPSGDGDWPESGICQRCSDEGIWLNGDGDYLCVCGCLPCVKRNDWTWGNVVLEMDWTSEESSVVVPVPCNGSRLVGPDETPTEYTNLEIIIETLSDMWDQIPDWETQDPETVPRWSRFFDMAPERTHMIVCKELNLWQTPETARNIPMEPGQPWTLQQLLPDSNVLEDSDDGGGISSRGNGLEPRQLFQDDDDEEVEERKGLCTEAQKLLDEATGDEGEFNEESYRLLSNILMKIHQM